MKEKNITIVSRDAPRRKGKTDWARLDAMTDEEIEASIANDPDWQEFKDIDWSKAVLVIPPKKKAISIRSTRTCSIISKSRAPAINGASTRCCAPICSKSVKSARSGHPAKSFFTSALALEKSIRRQSAA